MILILIKQEALRKSLAERFTELGLDFQFADFNSGYLDQIYDADENLKCLITESTSPDLPEALWLDILDAQGRRLPVLVIRGADEEVHSPETNKGRGQYVTWIHEVTANEIVRILDLNGLVGVSQRIISRESIPLYNPMLAVHMLKQNGSLSILRVHSSGIRKVAIEYGADAYFKLQVCLQQLLFELWGAKGSFRARDVLCRESANSNTYYILLEQSRSELGIPPPAALESLADRLVARLQYLFWEELHKPAQNRLIPQYLNVIPDITVGYSTALFNPCVDPTEVVESMIEKCKQMAKVQDVRINNRQKEVMQTLIHTDGFLEPSFQGVFSLDGLSDDRVVEAIKTKSLKPLEDYIYAFESLIRINAKKVDEVLKSCDPVYLESRFLRPDVLFYMAGNANLALELDQACLKEAARRFGNLPGVLLANILPRNFYYIDELQFMIPKNLRVIFEVSESEAINNFGLLKQARQKLPREFGIAIDDFGKGYAGLDRIINIKPEIIKLDRSLVSYIDQDQPKSAFVSGLVSAAAITNSTVLAEGIERMEELKVLRQLGVSLVQGFLLHKPQPKDEIEMDLCIADPLKKGTVA